MKIKRYDARELAEIVARRSTCHVKVGAVIYDNHGVFAWGWNSSGPDGYGLCAERHAISRANRGRLDRASMTVVSLRKGKQICSIPCDKCSRPLVKNNMRVYCMDEYGEPMALLFGGF